MTYTFKRLVIDENAFVSVGVHFLKQEYTCYYVIQ